MAANSVGLMAALRAEHLVGQLVENLVDLLDSNSRVECLVGQSVENLVVPLVGSLVVRSADQMGAPMAESLDDSMAV
eukprot:scaffold769_cov178-Ochromonas_danica.AAC.16